MFQTPGFKMQNKAFTLLELLIVLTIIAIMSALVFVDYGSRKQHFALQRSIYKLAQDIRRAGEMGMSAQEFQGSVPEGGYGIYLDIASATSYILFADLGPSPDHIYSGETEKVEEIKLEKKVYIKSLSPYSALNIVFEPPNPTITISNGAGTATTTNATTTLALETDPGSTRTVEVNLAGLIDID